MAAGRAGDALEVHGHLAGIVTVAGCQNYRGSVAGSVRVEGNGGFARVGAAAGWAGSLGTHFRVRCVISRERGPAVHRVVGKFEAVRSSRGLRSRVAHVLGVLGRGAVVGLRIFRLSTHRSDLDQFRDVGDITRKRRDGFEDARCAGGIGLPKNAQGVEGFVAIAAAVVIAVAVGSSLVSRRSRRR